MSGWLSGHRQNKGKIISPPGFQSAHGSNALGSGMTTYRSSNAAEQKMFYAEAPAGSQHAARLQKLALQQQSEYRPPAVSKSFALPQPRAQRSITARGEPLESDEDDDHLREYATSSRPKHIESARRRGDSGREPSEYSDYADRKSPGHQSRRHNSSSGNSRLKKSSGMEVNRYEVDGMMAYHKKSSGGELMISAPVGSAEAGSMDNAAARLGASSSRRERPIEYVEGSSRKGVVTIVREPKHHGRYGTKV